MDQQELTVPTLETLAADLTSGKTTSRALAEACLARIADDEGEGAHTFIAVDPARVRAVADAHDRLRAGGAAPSCFAGIPVSVKDLFDVTGEITRAGSIILADTPPAARDSPAIMRLRQAGFLLIGRTNMSEFAFSGLGLNPHYGTPRSVWDREVGRAPGGSSSGAAISVADFMAHGAIGTDTGGSCRVPAAFNRLVGYKPTARRLPLAGATPLSPSLDSIGPLARSVSCCAVLDAIMAGEEVPTLAPQSLVGRRLAVPTTLVLDGLDHIVAAQFEAALAKLAAAGAVLERIPVPEFEDIALANRGGGFAAAESYAWHRRFLPERNGDYNSRVLSRIMRGAEQSAADYVDLLAARTDIIHRFERRLVPFDAMVMPTVAILPPRLTDIATDQEFLRVNLLSLRNSSLANFLDACAISLPIGKPDDAPVGLMLSAPGGADKALLSLAAAVETCLR